VRVLVVNAGSSSLKLSVLDGQHVVADANLPAHRGPADPAAIEGFLGTVGDVDAVGHRIVHGGTEFTAPTLVDAAVRHRLQGLTDLAPLHQPASLAVLDAVGRLLPDRPTVACFDTAFHATIPPAAATYALPVEWRRRWPLRRFGFHGLSHAYVARRVPQLLEQPGQSLRIVSCHLGAGASVTAIRDGASVDTTMGFTPLDGLVMATRSGSIDPGLVLWLEEHAGMPPAALAAALEHRSGLLGLAGRADLKAVLAAETDGDLDAALAVAVYLHRLRAAVAAMAAATDGLDVLVFTGGVGEHAPAIRQRTADRLAFLGVTVDPSRNDAAGGDREISSPTSEARTFVLTAREDMEIARGVHQLVAGPS
jgi:acetate kinase